MSRLATGRELIGTRARRQIWVRWAHALGVDGRGLAGNESANQYGDDGDEVELADECVEDGAGAAGIAGRGEVAVADGESGDEAEVEVVGAGRVGLLHEEGG